MYLLDTNVVSEFRRPRPDRAVVRWVEGVPAEHLHVSSVTIGEIQAGIEITREQDLTKAMEIEGWLYRVQSTYEVLPVDGAAFREWARMMHGKSQTLILDALIASVAIVHSLTVVTRNVRDFERLGLEVLDPFDNGNGAP